MFTRKLIRKLMPVLLGYVFLALLTHGYAFQCTSIECYEINEKNLNGGHKFVSKFLENLTNEAKITLCDADENTLQCKSDDIGVPNIWTVPPFLPGRASVKSINFDLKKEKRLASVAVTYLKGKNSCSSSEFDLKQDGQKLNFSGTSYCNWLVVGNNLFSYSFDLIGFSTEKKSFYANYKLSIAGTAVGGSSGFAVLKLDNFEHINPDLALLDAESKSNLITGQNNLLIADSTKPPTSTQASSPNTPVNTALTDIAKAEKKQESKQAVSDPDIEKYKKDVQEALKRQKELEEQLKFAKEALNKDTKPKTESSMLRARALVIGNASYSGSSKLPNPANDASAMSAKLKELGFVVDMVLDANRNSLVSSLSKFAKTASDADISLLFYAGHGVQISGVNYMLPVDLNMYDLAQVPLQGVSLSAVVEQFMPGKTKLVFLDACRDNPLMQTASRSVSRGLAPINVSEGTLISYSTKDGQVAQDGDGKNSPFTTALLQHLGDPDDIAVVLRKVREDVLKNTGGKQQPWEYGSLTGGALVLSAIKSAR